MSPSRATLSLIPSSARGFTFVEVLAAMLFLAIVIPAVVHGLTVSNRLAVLTERKRVAAELADRLLTEKVATGEWRLNDQEGDLAVDAVNYHWKLSTEDWPQDSSLLQVGMEVQFQVQGRDCAVGLSTLVEEETS